MSDCIWSNLNLASMFVLTCGPIAGPLLAGTRALPPAASLWLATHALAAGGAAFAALTPTTVFASNTHAPQDDVNL